MADLLLLTYGAMFLGMANDVLMSDFRRTGPTPMDGRTVEDRAATFLRAFHEKPLGTAFALLPGTIAAVVATLVSRKLALTEGLLPETCES